MFVSGIIVSTAGNPPGTESTLCLTQDRDIVSECSVQKDQRSAETATDTPDEEERRGKSTAVRRDVLLTAQGGRSREGTRACDKRLLLSEPPWLKSHLDRLAGEAGNSCSTRRESASGFKLVTTHG